jgi:hypothetical protein
METERSLTCSQGPITVPYPKPDESNPHSKHYFAKIHFNIILYKRNNIIVSSILIFRVVDKKIDSV